MKLNTWSILLQVLRLMSQSQLLFTHITCGRTVWTICTTMWKCQEQWWKHDIDHFNTTERYTLQYRCNIDNKTNFITALFTIWHTYPFDTSIMERLICDYCKAAIRSSLACSCVLNPIKIQLLNHSYIEAKRPNYSPFNFHSYLETHFSGP